jgi:type VI secretion system protein ImpI/type VI secretion system protein
MLVMIRCPETATPERREVHGGDFSIGRGSDNEWVIPDPERHLSKKHCRIVYGMGDWELYDLSTNGTYLNQASEPIGRGIAQKLRNGDRIKFGPYELEVRIEGDMEAVGDGMAGANGLSGPFDQERPQSEFVREPRERSGSAFGDIGLSKSDLALDAPSAPILPPDFDPLAPGPDQPFLGPTQADHAPALQSAFRPPQPVAIIPDDWDAGLPGGSHARSPALPAAPPPAARPQPATAPSPPAAVAAPVPLAPAPPVAAPPGPAREEASDAAAAAGSAAGLVAAFLRGTGLSEATLREPEKTFERIGAATRATVSGLRQTLMARASIKDEFRIAQTVIRASGNNPLKFSLDDDDALATLLGTGRRGSMAPEEAVVEAFEDLRLHELATVSAMQAAVRSLLEQLAPEAIERRVDHHSLLPAQNKAKAWDAFVQEHKAVTQALSDDFDSAFGKAFARAYEQAIEQLTNDRKKS